MVYPPTPGRQIEHGPFASMKCCFGTSAPQDGEIVYYKHHSDLDALEVYVQIVIAFRSIPA